MISIGITGGLGSGKSVVARLLALQGIPVYIADDESKRLTAHSPLIRQPLTAGFVPAVTPAARRWNPPRTPPSRPQRTCRPPRQSPHPAAPCAPHRNRSRSAARPRWRGSPAPRPERPAAPRQTPRKRRRPASCRRERWR